MADETTIPPQPEAEAKPTWWRLRADRFAAARAALRAKETLVVIQPFGPMDNDIPGIDIRFADHTFFNDPDARADIYFNQGYQHNIEPLWDVIRSGRAGIHACWFWDNHHLFTSTLHAAMLADISFCAHSFASHYIENNELGEYGGFIPLSPIFWHDSLVRRMHTETAGRPRDDRLYGGYNSYVEFPDRDRFLDSVMAAVPESRIRIYPHGIRPHPYYILPAEEKLGEWLSFKVSLCASFGINTTIRMFEALLAGQIPIVVGKIHDLDMLFSPADRASLPMFAVEEYDPDAVRVLYREALARFDAEGQDGITRRAQHVLNNHSLRCRLIEMIQRIRGAPLAR